MFTTNGDSGAVRVGPFWEDFEDNFGICDFFATFGGNVMIVNYMEDFSAFYSLFDAI